MIMRDYNGQLPNCGSGGSGSNANCGSGSNANCGSGQVACPGGGGQ